MTTEPLKATVYLTERNVFGIDRLYPADGDLGNFARFLCIVAGSKKQFTDSMVDQCAAYAIPVVVLVPGMMATDGRLITDGRRYYVDQNV